MKSRKPKKKIQWRKQALGKNAPKDSAPINILPGMIPTVQQSSASPQSFREILMNRRQNIAGGMQPSPFPNYISQHSIGMDQYNRIRDSNAVKQQEIIDYKKLSEEEKARAQQMTNEMKELKKESKKNKQEAADEKKRADEAEKYRADSEKALKEVQESQVRLKQMSTAHDLLDLQLKGETTKAQIHELRMREEELKGMIQMNKVGHENRMAEQEVQILQARIKAHEDLNKSENYKNAVQRQTLLASQRLDAEEKLRLEEDIHKRRIANGELQAKIEAQKKFKPEAISKEYQSRIDTEIEKAAGLEAEYRKHEDQMYESDQIRKGYREAKEKNRESTAKLGRLQQTLHHYRNPDKDYSQEVETYIKDQVINEMKSEQLENLIQAQKQETDAQLEIYKHLQYNEEMASPEYIKRGIELATHQLAAKNAQEYQQYLTDTNEAVRQNRRAQASAYIIKYAEDNDIPLEQLTENIGEHLSNEEWKLPEHMKPAIVQQATRFVEGNVGRFVSRYKTLQEIKAAMASAAEGGERVFDEYFTQNEINILDPKTDVHGLSDDEFARQVSIINRILREQQE